MKNLLAILLLSSFLSCETERIIFTGPYYVRFTNSSMTVKESRSDLVQISVHNVGPLLEDDIVISYEISGDAREGVDFRISGSENRTVIIPANEYFGYINIELINNANNILRTQDVIITLTRVNNKEVRVGQSEGGIGKTFTLTIDDDCILSGDYLATREGSFASLNDVSITSQDCENYRISNWDVGIFFAADPVPLNFEDVGDNTILVNSQSHDLWFGFTETVTVEGIGSVNILTNEIFLSLTYSVTDGSSGNVQLTFNKP